MEVRQTQSQQFKVGNWIVKPALGRIEHKEQSISLEPLAMGILVYLAQRSGEVVSIDELVTEVWAGRIVADNTVYQWIRILRKALGDDPLQPTYIETISKRGYRLIADVRMLEKQKFGSATGIRRSQTVALAFAGALILLVVLVYFPPKNPVLDTVEKLPTSSVQIRPSIAVLPFTDHSSDASGLQFAEGIHEEVLTTLAKITSVKVVSRTSVLGRLDDSNDLRSIGQELGVETIMKGGVQRINDRLRINIQLVDVRTLEHIWAETFDRELTAANIFAIQTEIANSVAQALKVELSLEERDRISILPTENLAAYEAYLMGKHQLARRTMTAMSESIDLFQKVITLDPDFALAYVGLADAYYLLAWYGHENSDEYLEKSRDAIEHALKLNDSLGAAYATLGSLLENTDLGLSEAAFKRSINLSPNYATAYHWYGNILANSGQLEAAGIQYQKARELDPLSAIVNEDIASLSEQLGNFEMARRHYHAVINIDPSFGLVYLDFAVLMDTALGRLDESLVLLHRGLAMRAQSTQAEPTSITRYYLQIAHNYMQLGADDKAEFWIERTFDLSPDHFEAYYAKVSLQMLRGRKNETIEYPPELLPLQVGLNGLTQGVHGQARNVQRLFRNFDLQAGQYLKTRDRYAQNYPELLQPTPPEVNRQNYQAAIDLALVLRETGQTERADQLLEGSLLVIEAIPRLGHHGFQVNDVMIYTLQGAKEKALVALRQAIDMGWQYRARYLLEFEPNLFSLHADPEYRAMVAEVKARLAEQLRRVQEKERNGELVRFREITLIE